MFSLIELSLNLTHHQLHNASDWMQQIYVLSNNTYSLCLWFLSHIYSSEMVSKAWKLKKTCQIRPHLFFWNSLDTNRVSPRMFFFFFFLALCASEEGEVKPRATHNIMRASRRSRSTNRFSASSSLFIGIFTDRERKKKWLFIYLCCCSIFAHHTLVKSLNASGVVPPHAHALAAE